MIKIKNNFIKCINLVGVSAIALNARANDVSNATAVLHIDDDRFGVEIQQTSDGWQIPKGTVVGSEEDGGMITFTDGVKFDFDPSIAYGFAVIDFGAPSVFGFSFATPIVPTGPATSVASTLAAGLTDFTDNGISMTPSGATVQTSGVSSTGIGGPYTGMGVDIGPAFAAAGGGTGLPVAYVYGPYSLGLIPGPAGVFDAMKVDINFGLSGAGDVAALTGTASIVEAVDTPDGGPGMAGIGALVALLGIGSRKRMRR